MANGKALYLEVLAGWLVHVSPSPACNIDAELYNCKHLVFVVVVSASTREMSPVSCGSVVHLEGQCVSGCWVVDREQGFLVLLPDTLLSGTSVSSSIRCMRRAVLSDMFKVSAS